MTVSVTTNKNRYVSNGSLSTYPFTFKIFEEDDLSVYTQAGSTKTELTYGVDYTVSGTNFDSGGNILLNTVPNNGTIITIVGTYDYLQSIDYVEGDSFPANTHESGLDKAMLINIRQKETLDRCVKGPETNPSDVSYELPYYSSCASKYLAFSSDGKSIIASQTTPTSTVVSSYMATVLDDTTASGARSTLDVYSTSETDSKITTLTTTKVNKSDFDATSFLYATTAGNPEAKTPSEVNTILGITSDSKEYTASQTIDEESLTVVSGSNISWDVEASQNARATLDHNATLGNPTNAKQGGVYSLRVIQGTGTSWTLSYDTGYDFGELGTPEMTTVSDGEMLLVFYYDGSGMKAVKSWKEST